MELKESLNYYHVVFKRQLTIGIAKLHELLVGEEICGKLPPGVW